MTTHILREKRKGRTTTLCGLQSQLPVMPEATTTHVDKANCAECLERLALGVPS